MDTQTQGLAAKLHPARFTAMSGKMAAIVGCIIGESYTKPALAELTITSDGLVMGRREDDCGFNEILGSRSDLDRNWRNLLDVAGLTETERTQADMLYAWIVRW